MKNISKKVESFETLPYKTGINRVDSESFPDILVPAIRAVANKYLADPDKLLRLIRDKIHIYGSYLISDFETLASFLAVYIFIARIVKAVPADDMDLQPKAYDDVDVLAIFFVHELTDRAALYRLILHRTTHLGLTLLHGDENVITSVLTSVEKLLGKPLGDIINGSKN